MNSRGRGRGARGDRGGRGARGAGGAGGRGASAAASSSRSNVVASTGLFSEGAGDGTSKRLMGRFRSSDNSESSSSALRRPTIKKKERIDPTLEQKHIQEIYDLDDDPMEDDSIPNDNLAPINLIDGKSRIPHPASLIHAAQFKSYIPIRMPICSVKTDIKLETRINGLEIKDEPGTMPRKLAYPASIEDFFHRNTEQMFLLQVNGPTSSHSCNAK